MKHTFVIILFYTPFKVSNTWKIAPILMLFSNPLTSKPSLKSCINIAIFVIRITSQNNMHILGIVWRILHEVDVLKALKNYRNVMYNPLFSFGLFSFWSIYNMRNLYHKVRYRSRRRNKRYGIARVAYFSSLPSAIWKHEWYLTVVSGFAGNSRR